MKGQNLSKTFIAEDYNLCEPKIYFIVLTNKLFWYLQIHFTYVYSKLVYFQIIRFLDVQDIAEPETISVMFVFNAFILSGV